LHGSQRVHSHHLESYFTYFHDILKKHGSHVLKVPRASLHFKLTSCDSHPITSSFTPSCRLWGMISKHYEKQTLQWHTTLHKLCNVKHFGRPVEAHLIYDNFLDNFQRSWQSHTCPSFWSTTSSRLYMSLSTILYQLMASLAP